MAKQADPTQIPSWLPTDERRTPRKRLDLAALLTTVSFADARVRVSDVGVKGCRLNGPVHLNVGAFVTIVIPGFTSANGWVAWKDGAEIGVDFANHLPERVVDHIVKLGAKPA